MASEPPKKRGGYNGARSIAWSITHPAIVIVSITIVSAVILSIILSFSNYPSEHGDDIIDYTWGILLSIIATSVTTYVFMYESNRSLKDRLKYSVGISKHYESKVRNTLSHVTILTIVVVATGILLFPPFISLGHMRYMIYLYAALSGISISILFCNLAVMYSIIQSGKIISVMAVSGSSGIESKFKDMDPEYKDDSYFRMVAHAERFSKLWTGDGISVNDYLKVMSPLTTMVETIQENIQSSSEDSDEDPLLSGRGAICTRIMSSNFVDDSLGQKFISCKGLDMNGEDALASIERSIRHSSEPGMQVCTFLSDGIKIHIESAGSDPCLEDGYNDLNLEEKLAIDVVENKSHDKKGVSIYINGEKLGPVTSLSLPSDKDNYLILLEASFQSTSGILYDIWTRDYIMIYWLISNGGPIKEKLSNDIGKSVDIYNLVKTVQYYGWNVQDLTKQGFNFPLSAIVYRKLMFQKTLRNLDLTGSYLNWMSFYGSDMTGCNFTLSEITGSDFTTSILRNTIWIETKIGEAGALFNGADLSDAVFGQVSLNDRTVLDNCKLKNSIINTPELIGTSSIGMIANNVTVDQGVFQSWVSDDSTFEGSIFHQSLITRSDGDGYRITFGSGHLNDNKIDMDCRFRLVKGSVVLIDSVETTKVLITSSDPELIRKIEPLKKLEKIGSIRVSNAVSSRGNLETDWEYRPGYEITLDVAEINEMAVLTVNLKDIGAISDGITVYFDLISDDDHNVVRGGCDFEGSQFNNTRIWNSKVDGANMRSLDIRDCSFFGSDFFNTVFDGTRFEKVDMGNSVTVCGHYVGCSFNTTKMQDADIENNDFIRCSIRDVIMLDSVVDSCRLEACEIKTLNAINCTFIDTTVKDIKCKGTMYFERCKFIGNFEELLGKENIVLNDCILNGHTVSKNLQKM